ncbi:MAG: hypothetical protein AB7N71_10400 [Phycisphaerae bacterium]
MADGTTWSMARPLEARFLFAPARAAYAGIVYAAATGPTGITRL